jgi:hypothetical protein
MYICIRIIFLLQFSCLSDQNIKKLFCFLLGSIADRVNFTIIMGYFVGLVAQSASGLWNGEYQVSVYRIPTLCNQLHSHLWVNILQTLHSCYVHIEDVHVTIWKSSYIFEKFPYS